MTFDIVSHLKVTGIAATDEWVQKRSRGITQLAARFRKRGSGDILALADAVVGILARGYHPLPEALREEVFGAIRKAAPTFVPDSKSNAELGLCAILGATVAVMDTPDNDFYTVTGLASALLSGCQFIRKSPDAKLELLRRDIVQTLGDRLHVRAETVRRRSTATTNPTLPAAKAEDSIDVALARFAAPVQKALEGVHFNSSRDREELDLLWWRINQVGTIVPGRFSAMTDGQAAVCAGLEVANLLTLSVASDAHRAIAAGVLKSPLKQLTVSELLTALSGDLNRIRGSFSLAAATVEKHPVLFPLLYAIQMAGTDTTSAALAAARLDPKVSWSAEEWCARALDEAVTLERLGFRLTIPAPVRI